MAFNIVAGVNNAIYGSVSGSGSYEENAEVTLEVTVNDGYRFVQWDDGNTDNPRVFNATADVTLVATLEAIPEYAVTLTENNSNLGSTSGSGNYLEGSTATISATPALHCRFVKWDDDNTDNPRTLTVNAAITLEAIFETVNWYTIAAVSSDDTMGSVTGAGDYDEGSTVTLTAVPETDYKFTEWSDGNTDNPRIFTASQSLNLSATFAAIIYSDVTIVSNDNELGTVSGATSGNIETGSSITLTATPATDCKFDGWQIDGEMLEDTSTTITLTVAENEMDVIAVFSAIVFYQVNLLSSDTDCGYIDVVSQTAEPRGTNNNIWPEGTVLELAAVETSGGRFLNWGDGSLSLSKTITVYTNQTVRANFYPVSGLILVTKKIFQHAWNTIKSFFSAPTGASKIGAPTNNALGATTLADVVNSVGQANGLAQLNEDGKINISDLGGSGSSGLDVDITGNAATATSAASADVATKLGTTTVGASDTPIYLNAGTATACGGSLAVDITGNAATATTASKLGNTTAVGNASNPVYFSANGVPTVCSNFASASIAASDSTTTTAGWFRIFSLNAGYENGLIIVGGGGWGTQAPCSAVLSFSLSNARPNISLIASGNVNVGAGASTTKIRITCSSDGRYVEAYNNPTAQNRNQFFRIFTNISGAVGYNIAAGSTPNGAELSYTATVDINKNAEPCLHTTDSAVGSTSLPVYIDANGIAQTCSAYQGSVPIYYVQGPSTDTTAGTWTGSITGLTAYYDGLTILYVPAVAGASATTLNINNLGAKTCYYTNTSALTTHYSVGTPILLTYRDNAWRRADYNSNTTYSAMSVSEGTTGTATTARTMRADYLKQIIAALPSASCTGNAATATTASACSGNAASSTYTSNIRVAKNTASAWYPLVFVTGSTANTNYAPKYHPGLNVDCYDGTTSANGYCFLQLGTATAFGTAGNAYGGIYLYKKATSTYKTPKRVIIVPPNVAAATDADVTVTLPNATGTLALTSSDITGNAATATTATSATSATTATNANNLKTTTVADAKWYSLLGVLYNTTSGANAAVYRCSTSMDLGWYNQANSANTSSSLLAYTILRVGNNTANAADGVGRRGILRLHSNTAKRIDLMPPDNLSADRDIRLPSTAGTLALTSSNITGSASKWDGYALKVDTVANYPASPDANTIYLLK